VDSGISPSRNESTIRSKASDEAQVERRPHDERAAQLDDELQRLVGGQIDRGMIA
jgi:hypothetical protein